MRLKRKKVFYEFGEIDKTNNRITEMLTVEGLEKSKKIEALIDTGAQRSLIDLKLASEIGIKLTGEINRVGGLESDSEKLEGKIRIELDNSNNRYMTVKDTTVDLVLTLWPNLNQRVGFPLLLGMDFWLAAEKRNMKFSLNLD